MENKAGLIGQTVPGRRIPGHWPYPGPEELAETEPVGPDAWTFLSFNYHPASALALGLLSLVPSSLGPAPGRKQLK